MTKKIASTMLAVILLLTVFPFGAAAQESEPAQDIPGAGVIPTPGQLPKPGNPPLPAEPGVPGDAPIIAPPSEEEPGEEPAEAPEEPDEEPADEEPAEPEPEETPSGEPAAQAEARPAPEAAAAVSFDPEAETRTAEGSAGQSGTAVSRRLAGYYIGAAAALLALIVLALLLLRKRKPTPPCEGIPLQLVVLQGKCRNAGEKIYLLDQLYIGTDPSCRIVWKDGSVSPRHCRIYVRNDAIYIEDLNDRSATAIDGMKIYAPNRLRSEDEISMGDVRFKLLF